MKNQNFIWPHLSIITIPLSSIAEHCLWIIFYCASSRHPFCCDLCFIHILLCGHNIHIQQFILKQFILPFSSSENTIWYIHITQVINIIVFRRKYSNNNNIREKTSFPITNNMSRDYIMHLAHWPTMLNSCLKYFPLNTQVQFITDNGLYLDLT